MSLTGFRQYVPGSQELYQHVVAYAGFENHESIE